MSIGQDMLAEAFSAEGHAMQVFSKEFYPGGALRSISGRHGNELVQIYFGIASHKAGDVYSAVFSVDVFVDGVAKEHLSVQGDGQVVSIFAVNAEGKTYENSTAGISTIEELDASLRAGHLVGALHDWDASGLAYLRLVAPSMPVLQGVNPDGLCEAVLDGKSTLISFPEAIVPHTDASGNRIVSLLCIAAPIATVACIVGVAILFYSSTAE